MSSFGRIIWNRRREMGLQLYEIAEACDISASYLSDIERDRRNPPSDSLLEKLAANLGFEIPEIYMLAGRLPPAMLKAVQENLDMANIIWYYFQTVINSVDYKRDR